MKYREHSLHDVVDGIDVLQSLQSRVDRGLDGIQIDPIGEDVPPTHENHNVHIGIVADLSDELRQALALIRVHGSIVEFPVDIRGTVPLRNPAILERCRKASKGNSQVARRELRHTARDVG